MHVLLPGETPGHYQAENEHEGFLVLSGECDAVAAAHGASVSRPTTSPEEAYADRPAFSRVSAPPPFAP